MSQLSASVKKETRFYAFNLKILDNCNNTARGIFKTAVQVSQRNLFQ